MRMWPKCPTCGKKVTSADSVEELRSPDETVVSLHPSMQLRLEPCGHLLPRNKLLMRNQLPGLVWWGVVDL
jgi:hypothetical protein